jgi:hypothetical protein
MVHPGNSRSQVTLPARVYYDLFPNSAPAPPWEVAVAHFLLERGHDIALIRSVLDQAREHGSVECCESLDDLDRAAVEDLLPEAPARCWGQYPGRWTLAEQHP